MANLFECGVVIKLLDQVSAPLANLATGFARTNAAAEALQARMNKIHSTFSSGLMMVGGGIALAAPLIAATNEAAKLEKAMTNVKQITRASQEEMERYNPLLTTISHKTAVFSKAMLAEGAAHMAQGGIRTSTDIQKLLPLFSDAADILKITKHVDSNQTFDALTKIAHQMGNFEPNAAMMQTVKDFVTVAQVSPGSVSNFASGGAYVNPLANRLFKIDERSLFALQTTMAQTGGGGKGGLSPAQQMNMLSRSLPGIFGSGLLEGKSAWGLKVLGLTDKQGLSTLKNKDGSFDLMKLSEKFNAFEKLGDTAAGRMQIARIIFGLRTNRTGQ